MTDPISSLEHRLYTFLQRPDYEPMKQHELARALKVGAGRQGEVRAALRRLEAKGLVVSLRKNRWAVANQNHFILGTLSVHRDGFGFVSRSAEPDREDIFIPARRMGTALHGDQVQVALGASGRGRRGKRRTSPKPEQEDGEDSSSGRIVRVVERHFTKVSGVLTVSKEEAYVAPDHPRIAEPVYIQGPITRKLQQQHGHRVVAELLPWEDARDPLPGRIVEDLGPADAPGSDILGLLRSHGLESEFSTGVEQSARAIRNTESAVDDENRRDLREELIFTIDPEDARDFDDAVSLARTDEGNWLLSVHIADVASYVTPDSDIDKEARQRGNSVYLVDRVITMLPRYLTEEVCSLNPNTDRFAHTARMTLSPRGKLLSVETFPALIRSSVRLNYDQVQAYLQGEPVPDINEPVGRALKDMEKLSTLLRRKRARKGSVLFDMPEVRCVLNDEGQTVDIVPRKSFTAYHLIEEFMLVANQAVARRISEKGHPAIYRIHAPPDDEQWEKIAVDLGALGYTLPDLSRASLNKVADTVSGKPESHIVNLAMLRNLNRAVYSAKRAEHFGLAFSHYVHFTSPIRRYADLVIHRVLKAIERTESAPYSKEAVARIADHISATEREAAEAEQESVDLKRIEFYGAQLDAGNTGPFKALVTSMTNRGLLVELTETLQRGLVPFALIHGDHYSINEQRNRAVGRRTRATWKVGDVLDVELVRVDKAKKLVDFRPVTQDKKRSSTAGGRRKGKGKGRPQSSRQGGKRGPRNRKR